MTRRKLEFEILKMVDNVLFDSLDFNLNKKIPSEVRVLRTGVFRTYFSDPHCPLNASLLTPVKFQKSLSERLIDDSKSIQELFCKAMALKRLTRSKIEDLFSKEFLLAFIWDHTSALKYPSSTWFGQHLLPAGIIISHLKNT